MQLRGDKILLYVASTKSELKILDKLSNNGLSDGPYEVVKFNDEPKIPTYISTANKHAQKKYSCEYEAYGFGSGLNPDIAKIKSIAEFLERLALFNPQKKNLLKQEYTKNSCINPRLFLHYSHAQMNSHEQAVKKLENATLLWSPAIDYLNKKKVLIPSQSVYLADIFQHEMEIFPERISTGAAFAVDQKRAFKSGLLEAIERDAAMITYLNKKKAPKIINFPEPINDIISYLKRYYIDISIFDITTDLNVPTFMSVACNKRGFGPAVSVGLKSGFDAEHTIYGCILESLQSRRQARFGKVMEGNKFDSVPVDSIDTKQARYFYWYPTKMIRYLDFWLKNNTVIKFNKIPQYTSSLNDCVKELKDRGYHIFYADMTLDEIKKMGFIAAKVVIPELQPLYLSEYAKVLYSVHAGEIVPPKGLKPHPFT